MNDELVDAFPDPDLHPDGIIEPVGGTDPWYHFETTFTADDDMVTLLVSTMPAGVGGGDSTFIVDNISIDRASAGPVPLAGDADLDRDFDQLDLVKVQVAAKYLTVQPATWGEGDWNGAPDPGSSFDSPPAGDGFFNQLDIIAALSAGTYLTGPYAAVQAGGQAGDGQTPLIRASTARCGSTPAGTDLASVNIESASGFSGAPAENLGGTWTAAATAASSRPRSGRALGRLALAMLPSRA
jgi:hypothetical protein